MFGRGAIIASLSVCLLLAAGPVLAYTIDSSDNDWVSGYASENVDGSEPGTADKYDIWVNRSSYESGTWYFYFRTMASYPTGYDGDFAEIYVDADRNSSTGGPFDSNTGYDYRLTWDLGDRTASSASGSATLYAWNEGAYDYITTGNSYSAARGVATYTGPNGNEMFVEWSLPGSAIVSSGNILWGAYLDDYEAGADDLCPDEMDQPGVPEPSTLLLSLVPALGILLKSRRGARVGNQQR